MHSALPVSSHYNNTPLLMCWGLLSFESYDLACLQVNFDMKTADN